MWLPEEKKASKIVFIGKNLNKAELEKSLKEFVCTPEEIKAIEEAQERARMESGEMEEDDFEEGEEELPEGEEHARKRARTD